jgi:hypothetical protein
MDLLVALGISIGVLAGLWGQFSGAAGLVTWVAFVSWACFFAAGGKKEGLIKVVASNISGVVWGLIIVFLLKTFAFQYGLGVYIAIAVFFVCLQAKISFLSFIPGTFVGIACFFGTSFNWQGTIIALVIGACLGFVSEYIGVMLTKAGKKAEAGVEAEA